MTEAGHCFDSRQHDARTSLARFIGAKMGLEQGWHLARLQKTPPRAGDKRPHLGWSVLKLLDERRAAIHHGDDVFEVVADSRILPASVMKRREFRR